MILVHYTPDGLKRISDLHDIFYKRTCILVGGAPSLKEQPIELLNTRGLLIGAINNAAIHVKPSLWFSGDHPDCYDPYILKDPSILKLAPIAYSKHKVLSDKYRQLPNMFFYTQASNTPWDEFLNRKSEIPWYSNTIMVAIHALYMLGIRRIILAGSDFGFSKDGDMYAHKTALGSLEKKWNMDLYNSLVMELRMLKPIFDKANLELLDSSKYSRLAQVYRHITLEEAVELALKDFPSTPVDPATLPHCSKFASIDIKKAIAGWPNHSKETKRVEESYY